MKSITLLNICRSLSLSHPALASFLNATPTTTGFLPVPASNDFPAIPSAPPNGPSDATQISVAACAAYNPCNVCSSEVGALPRSGVRVIVGGGTGKLNGGSSGGLDPGGGLSFWSSILDDDESNVPVDGAVT